MTITNKASYSGLDYATIRDNLLVLLQQQFGAEYNDVAESSLGQMLLELQANGLADQSFYLDRRASGNFISTARTRAEATRAARIVGYKPTGAIASPVDLTVALAKSSTYLVTIPVGYQFKGQNKLVFEASEKVEFAPGDTGPKTVPVYEGVTYSDRFVSDGSEAQTFRLSKVPSDKFLAFGTVEVTVSGTPWVEVDQLEFAATNQFEVGYTDSPPTIRFGDGIGGNIPGTGYEIAVSYVVTSGLAGQAAQGTITGVVNPLVVAGESIKLIVTNDQRAGAGDDPESVSQIVKNAPKVFKTRNVAVTRTDYASLSGAYAHALYGRVAAASAVAARSAADDTALIALLAVIDGLASAAVAPTTTALSNLRTGFALILTALASMDSSLSSTEVALAALYSNYLATAISNARNAKSAGDEGIVASTAQAVAIASLESTVDGIPEGGTDTLTAGTKASIQELLTTIGARQQSQASSASSASLSSNQTLTALAQAVEAVALIGVDRVTSGTYLYNLQQVETIIASTVGISSPASGLYSEAEDIETAVQDTSTETSVATQAVFDHVDESVAADCSANIVTVPILAKNSAGFYVAPSVGLIRSLQDYLDARKDITHTVQVVSGADALIEASLRVSLVLLPNIAQSQMEASATTILDGILKGRAFGDSLYRNPEISSKLDSLKELGVHHYNVDILGHLVGGVLDTSLLDSEGNLIITRGQVITKGSVVVSSSVLSES